jgi:hypothetical protein
MQVMVSVAKKLRGLRPLGRAHAIYEVRSTRRAAARGSPWYSSNDFPLMFGDGGHDVNGRPFGMRIANRHEFSARLYTSGEFSTSFCA